MAASKTYRAWLELEIGLDRHTVCLPHSERVAVIGQRIEQGLMTLERASPGLRAKLEVFDGRPFAFTGTLTKNEIRAIWHLPELCLLSDHEDNRYPDPEPDEHGCRPYIVIVHQHIQAEGNSKVEIDRFTLLLHERNEERAMIEAIEQCRSAMPVHFMGSNYIIHRRWWTVERAYLNTLKEEERDTFGSAMVLRADQTRSKKAEAWQPDTGIEHVAYGSPKQRPKTWEWMLN